MFGCFYFWIRQKPGQDSHYWLRCDDTHMPQLSYTLCLKLWYILRNMGVDFFAWMWVFAVHLWYVIHHYCDIASQPPLLETTTNICYFCHSWTSFLYPDAPKVQMSHTLPLAASKKLKYTVIYYFMYISQGKVSIIHISSPARASLGHHAGFHFIVCKTSWIEQTITLILGTQGTTTPVQ